MAATTTLPKPFSSSSSSSSYQPPDDYEYDVFLSFRGKDTGKNFTDHLYRALKDAGIHTFIDEEIRRGEDRYVETLRAIEGSRILLIILSKNYASSLWCLNELVKILECQRRSNQTVVPIFYDVSPSDVRNQGVTFEHKFRHLLNERKVSSYRAALQEIANTSGWNLESTADG